MNDQKKMFNVFTTPYGVTTDDIDSYMSHRDMFYRQNTATKTLYGQVVHTHCNSTYMWWCRHCHPCEVWRVFPGPRLYTLQTDSLGSQLECVCELLSYYLWYDTSIYRCEYLVTRTRYGVGDDILLKVTEGNPAPIPPHAHLTSYPCLPDPSHTTTTKRALIEALHSSQNGSCRFAEQAHANLLLKVLIHISLFAELILVNLDCLLWCDIISFTK